MPNITEQATLAFEDGSCGKAALYAVKNADAGDTIDVSAQFSIVKRAGLVSQTNTHIAAVSAIAGSVLTIPAGPQDDGVWLLVVGVAK